MFILYPVTKFFIYHSKDKSHYRSIGPGDTIQYIDKDKKCNMLILGISDEEMIIEGVIDREYVRKKIPLNEVEQIVCDDYLCDTEFKRDWLLYSVEQKAYYSIGDTFSVFSLTNGVGKIDVTFDKVFRGNIGTNVYLTNYNDKSVQIVLNNPDYTGRMHMNDIKAIPFYDDYVAVSPALNKPIELAL